MAHPLLLIIVNLLITPQEIVYDLNNYFVNVASDFQSSIKYSKNNFHDFSLHVSF